MFVIGIIFFILLVIVHEYGHFLVAKRNGVDVEEFGIGFPPKLVGKKMGKGIFKSYYTINLLPLGGFVRLKGEYDADTRKNSFGSASLWAKVKIMMAGVAMNFVTGVFIFIVLAFVGMPKLLPNQFEIPQDQTITRDDTIVTFIAEETPATQTNIELNDNIISVNGEKVESTEGLNDLTDKYAGEQVTVAYERGENVFEESVSLNKIVDDGFIGIKFVEDTLVIEDFGTNSNAQASGMVEGSEITAVNGQTVANQDELKKVLSENAESEVAVSTKKGDSEKEFTVAVNEYNDRARLGLNTTEVEVSKYTYTAPIVGVATAVQMTVETIKGLGGLVANLFTGQFSEAADTVSGPVGVVVILQNATSLGFIFVLFIIGLISLTLAIMNAMPIPALDGGRLAVTLLYKGLKKELTPKAEQIIHGTGFAVLMVLVFLITIVDVDRFL